MAMQGAGWGIPEEGQSSLCAGSHALVEHVIFLHLGCSSMFLPIAREEIFQK